MRLIAQLSRLYQKLSAVLARHGAISTGTAYDTAKGCARVLVALRPVW